MVLMNTSTLAPSHRQNRRRERPGSRTRRTVNRKANLKPDFSEGYLDAYDPSVSLPSDRARPSPLLRESIHQTWQRWKDREAEEQALAEMDRLQALERELLLYGGCADDDELYQMGILHDDTSSNLIHEVPHKSPLYNIRPHKRRAPKRQRSTWVSLPLHLSLSNLSDDNRIKEFISVDTTTLNTIQHRRPVPKLHISLDPPQSLPVATLAFGESHTIVAITSPIQQIYQDWELIDTSPQASTPLTEVSLEPETWILLSDDS